MKYFIHVEKIWNEFVFNNLIRLIKKKNGKCYLFLMAPSYQYQYSVLGYRGTKTQLNQILTKRYTQLKELRKEYDFDVGLHVHFSLFPKELSKKEKEKELSKAFVFFTDVMGANPKSIAFGWFKPDEYLKNICKKLGLEIKHYARYTVNIHDYDLPVSRFKVLENFIKDNLRRWLRKNVK